VTACPHALDRPAELSAAQLLTCLTAVAGELFGPGHVLAGIAPDDDLWDAGMSSLDVVRLMIAVQDHFDVELSDEALTRDAFRDLRSVAQQLEAVLGERAARLDTASA